MKFYQSNLLTNILVFALGLLFIISPTALISTGLSHTNSFYPDLLLCLIFGWIILDPKNSSISILILLSFFADILWYRPLGLWPLLILLGSLSIKLILTKISVDSFFLKVIYFILFFYSGNFCSF